VPNGAPIGKEWGGALGREAASLPMRIRVRAFISGPAGRSQKLGRAFGAMAVLSSIALYACGSSPTPSPSPISITCPAGRSVDSPEGTPVAVTFDAPVTSGGTAPVMTTCSPASGSLFPVGSTTVVCQAADASGRATSCTLAVVVQVPPQLLYTQITAFGDSITEGKASEPVAAGSALFRELSRAGPVQAEQAFYQSPEPYPEGVQRRLTASYPSQSLTVVNAGLGGERAANALSRFKAVLASTRPEVVLLMEGTNDLSSATGAGPAITGLDAMVMEALAQGRRVCLATIAPIRAGGLAHRDSTAARVPAFNDRVRALAAARRVVLVDVYNAMKDDMDTLIGIDDLHPTEQGIAVIADTFTVALRANFERTPTTAAASRARW
jgi:lysophospholipase L1-like esterase